MNPLAVLVVLFSVIIQAAQGLASPPPSETSSTGGFTLESSVFAPDDEFDVLITTVIYSALYFD
jgi:hypothetical protein